MDAGAVSRSAGAGPAPGILSGDEAPAAPDSSVGRGAAHSFKKKCCDRQQRTGRRLMHMATGKHGPLDRRRHRLSRGGAVLALLLALPIVEGPLGAARAQELQGTVRFAWWGGPTRNAKTNAVVDLFETRHPNVTIERETAEFAAYRDRIAVQAAGGNQPCIIQMQSRYIDRYAKAGMFRPLGDLVASGAIDLEGIAGPILATGRQNGELVMVPYGMFFNGITFNRTLFERAGIEPPTADWTWEDFVADAKALQAKLPAGVVATDLMGGVSEPFFAYVLGHGEPVFSETGLGFGKERMIAWYEMWEDLRRAGVTQSADRMAEVGNNVRMEESALGRGQTAMTKGSINQIDAFQNAAKQAGDYVIDMQKNPNGPAGSGDVVGTNGLSIGATCPPEQVPIAAAFIDFFTQDAEAAKLFASDNGLVSVDRLRKMQAEDPESSYGLIRQIRLMEEIGDDMQPEVYPEFFGEIRDLLFSNYQSVAFEVMSIEEAVDAFFAEAAQIAKR